MNDVNISSSDVIPEYGKNPYVTDLVDGLFRILGVLSTFTQDYELLMCINNLCVVLRGVVKNQATNNNEGKQEVEVHESV